MNLNDYGFTPDLLPEDAQGVPARITAVHRERCALVCEHGEGYGRLKKGAYYAGAGQFPTVGDFVLIDWSPAGDSRILRTLPRRTYFFRRAPLTGGEQAVAANCDWVFVMQSMNQNFNLKRLERYLAAAWQSGAEPVVVLTKADLAGDPAAFVREAQAAAPGGPGCWKRLMSPSQRGINEAATVKG